MASEDTEITLGVGKLLGLFFILAAICAVFFSIGYSLGKSTAREQALNDQPTSVLAASPLVTATTAPTEEKPSAALASNSETPAPQDQSTAVTPGSNLTFYKAVQNSANAQPPAKDSVPAATRKASTTTETAAASTPSVSVQGSEAAHSAVPPVSHSVPVTGPGTIVVQISALSREDDAVALAGALRKKNYNVFVVNNPATNDKFYHVQVGPFATMPEADAMKAKLIAEGYNPIVKR